MTACSPQNRAPTLIHHPHLFLLPKRRCPSQRSVDDVPSEGVLLVKDVAEMGELVSSLTQRLEQERQDRYESEAGGRPTAFTFSPRGSTFTLTCTSRDRYEREGGAPPPNPAAAAATPSAAGGGARGGAAFGGGGPAAPEAPPEESDDDDDD